MIVIYRQLNIGIKLIYSKKVTKFCKVSIEDLSYVVTVKSTVEISQNVVVFSEYMNFKYLYNTLCINGRVAANRQMNKGKVQEFDEF